jgi:hypothetical protein
MQKVNNLRSMLALIQCLVSPSNSLKTNTDVQAVMNRLQFVEILTNMVLAEGLPQKLVRGRSCLLAFALLLGVCCRLEHVYRRCRSWSGQHYHHAFSGTVVASLKPIADIHARARTAAHTRYHRPHRCCWQ